MRQVIRSVLACCALTLAMSAHAADPETAPEKKSEIVVNGQPERVDPKEVTRQARSVTRETDLRHEPMARFDDRMCPGVMGLVQNSAEDMVGRIRMVAEDLGIPLETNGKCSANVIVGFTEDGRADLAKFEKHTRELSQDLEYHEMKELLDDAGPVHVWSIVQRRMQNGTLVPKRRNLVQIPVGRMEGGQSLISTATEQHIVGVIVLFDRDKVQGKTLHQLADYTVMRVFARTRDAKGPDAPDSILTLFNKDIATPPDGLTDFDRAYLASLYEGPAHLPGLGRMLRVSRNLEKIGKTEE